MAALRAGTLPFTGILSDDKERITLTAAGGCLMQLGYFTMPLHPPERDYTTTLREDREAIILADKLGYSEAVGGEHATARAETITSCLMFIASLIAQTQRIKLGSGTVNSPNSHPAAVAAQ